jgi:hypothetical protein
VTLSRGKIITLSLAFLSQPAAMVEAKVLIGEKKVGKRVLSDDEIVAFWDATERLRYPFGPLLRLLLVTGCRVNEMPGARFVYGFGCGEGSTPTLNHITERPRLLWSALREKLILPSVRERTNTNVVGTE